MALGTPTARAFRFVLDGENQRYDGYIDLHEHDGSLFVLDLRYRRQNATGDKWTFLHAEPFNETEVSNAAKVMAETQRILDTVINPKIKEVFGSKGEKPISGWELVQWIVSYQLKEQDNVISINR